MSVLSRFQQLTNIFRISSKEGEKKSAGKTNIQTNFVQKVTTLSRERDACGYSERITSDNANFRGLLLLTKTDVRDPNMK